MFEDGRERAQLRHPGQQGAGQDRAYTGHASQERLVLAQGGAALDRRLQIALGAGELLLEPPDVGLDAFGHRLGRPGQAVVLGVEQALATAAAVEPWGRGSMYHDLANGLRLELEALNGEVVRRGDEQDIKTPLNFVIYAALKPYINGAPVLP